VNLLGPQHTHPAATAAAAQSSNTIAHEDTTNKNRSDAFKQHAGGRTGGNEPQWFLLVKQRLAISSTTAASDIQHARTLQNSILNPRLIEAPWHLREKTCLMREG
jgi:hypothetical protein